jgi:adenosylhomocysteine nucleosidase
VLCEANSASSGSGPILILGAVPKETPFIVERLENREEGELYGFRYYTGQLGEHTVVISLTSVGKAHTAMCTALFIQTFEPSMAFMTGTASRTNPKKRTGDIVIPHTVFFHDYGSQTPEGILLADFYLPSTRDKLSRFLPVDGDMRATAAELLKTYTPHEVTVDGLTYPVTIDSDGIVASGDLLGVQQARIDFLRTLEVDLMEMESAAFALTCMQMEIPFLIVRSGSNLTQAKPSDEYLVYSPIAANSAARLTHFLVTNWPDQAE